MVGLGDHEDQGQTTSASTIEYRIDGPDQGPWVTMSNSLATTLHMWDAQIDALTKHYRVLRYDHRGHGESDAPPGPYSFELLADDALALLDALSIKQTHFVGLSMGGMTGRTLALQDSSVLRSLVLCDTASRDPYGDPAEWQQRIDSIRVQGNLEMMVEVTLSRFLTPDTVKSRPHVADAVRDMVRNTPLDGYVGSCQALSKFNVTNRLSEIATPTMVVVGMDDLSTPVEMAEEIHHRVAGSELVTLKNAAHLSNLDQPDAFNEAELGFIARQ
ncbi:MAG: 3-oxoadipate enol-lactonase [Actinomycetota bacterium]